MPFSGRGRSRRPCWRSVRVGAPVRLFFCNLLLQAAQPVGRPAVSSAAQPAEQSAPVHVYARLERDSGFGNPYSVLFASLRSMNAGQKFSFLRENKIRTSCVIQFFLKVGAELAEAPPGSRVQEERVMRGRIADSHFRSLIVSCKCQWNRSA